MDEPKHTPGPWDFEPTAPGAVITFRRPHWQIGQTTGKAVGVAIAFGETDANARLIAAAPDLLAACQALEVLNLWALIPQRPAHWPMTDWKQFQAATDAVTKAVAKATGEKP